MFSVASVAFRPSACQEIESRERDGARARAARSLVKRAARRSTEGRKESGRSDRGKTDLKESLHRREGYPHSTKSVRVPSC